VRGGSASTAAPRALASSPRTPAVVVALTSVGAADARDQPLVERPDRRRDRRIVRVDEQRSPSTGSAL
jgi:hypothetical protein